MPVRTPPRIAAAVLLLLAAGCGPGGEDTGATTTAASAAVPPAASVDASGSPSALLSATNYFLASLDAAQKQTVLAERTPANLAQWSNLPDQLFPRAGLRMDALSEDQKGGVRKILRSGLSTEGFNQVAGITTADGVLAASAQMNLDFGADHYWVRILGTPAATGIWTVQYGGHHLAVNMTVRGDRMTIAPTFWGAQPASYTAGGSTSEPLGGETRKAFALIGGLDAPQQRAAVLDTAVSEIVLGAGQDGKRIANEGVRAATFTDAQRTLLTDLLTEWIGAVNPVAARAKLATAARELDQTYFAWYGDTTIGHPVYYRITSPSYVIEFAHQQGQGANAGGVTHIHGIYRELGNDYGASL
ncbi:DUF3500 domain-containing protein [Paractinoplanes rishiriensis]|uniref:DUF3500 domain-containing protein n=1 Tax=Paractinoplanes rishiriensis TaxID=1050105 RepID=A0A919N094_9ACTN|nr:DUF3500 domain-containing protein [Actinoplanes rishiriensis]GIE99335.1 hypothetical protein Ari01nite_68000 [Actinoplanes rishiriensis]